MEREPVLDAVAVYGVLVLEDLSSENDPLGVHRDGIDFTNALFELPYRRVLVDGDCERGHRVELFEVQRDRHSPFLLLYFFF